jgi:hypothetical protein
MAYEDESGELNMNLTWLYLAHMCRVWQFVRARKFSKATLNKFNKTVFSRTAKEFCMTERHRMSPNKEHTELKHSRLTNKHQRQFPTCWIFYRECANFDGTSQLKNRGKLLLRCCKHRSEGRALLRYIHAPRIVVEALCYKAEVRGFETRWGELTVSIYLIILAALGPRDYSASNKNEYQKQKRMFVASRARPVLKTANLTSIWEPTL